MPTDAANHPPSVPLPTLAEIVDWLFTTYRDQDGRKLLPRDVALYGDSVSVDAIQLVRNGKSENPTHRTIEAICLAFQLPPILLFPKLWPLTLFWVPPNIPDRAPFPVANQFIHAEHPFYADKSSPYRIWRDAQQPPASGSAE